MSKLIMNDYPLLVLPQLAVKIGLNEAMFIQQLYYWIQKSKHVRDGYSWVYNTYEDWLEQFPFWSLSTIRRTIGKLEKSGLIVTGNYNSYKSDQTKWYRINQDLLDRITGDNENRQEEVMSTNLGTSQLDRTLSEWSAQDESEPIETVQIDEPIGPVQKENKSIGTVQAEPKDVADLAVTVLKLNKPLPETTSESTKEKKEKEEEENVREGDQKDPTAFFKKNEFGKAHSCILGTMGAWFHELLGDFVLYVSREWGRKWSMNFEGFQRLQTDIMYRVINLFSLSRWIFKHRKNLHLTDLTTTG